MTEFLNNAYNFIIDLVNSSQIYGPIIACILIFFESIIPVLPLFVFITIIYIAYGYQIGFLLSYILTCLGCFFSFYLCRRFLHNFFENKLRKNTNLNQIMNKIDKISMANLTVLIAIPFTPAFLINIAAALSNMQKKKYMIAILIGKIFLVFFWGFIGTSLVESLKNPRILISILIMLLMAYILARIVMKKMNIE